MIFDLFFEEILNTRFILPNSSPIAIFFPSEDKAISVSFEERVIKLWEIVVD